MHSFGLHSPNISFPAVTQKGACSDCVVHSFAFHYQLSEMQILVDMRHMTSNSPAQSDPNQTRNNWPEFTALRNKYIEMLRRFRMRYELDTEAKALEVFRAKMAAGPSEKVTRVFLMNSEELSKWLRKTAFTFCYEVPESSEGLETEIRTVLMEVDDRTEDKWDDLDPVGTVNLTPAQRFGPNLGGEDVTVSLPVSEEEINRERKSAERSVTLSEKSESIRAAEKAKKEQATKKPKFEFPKIYTQQDVLARSARGDASVARAPGKSLPVVPPTDVEMAEAVEARIPNEEEDMQGDTNTEAPAPSIDSTVRSEEIVGRTPERRKLGDRFFRASVVSSQVSSTLDTQAEEQLSREEVGRNPDAAPSGHRRPPGPAQEARGPQR